MNREKLQAHAHRMEARTTPGGEERTASLNANQTSYGSREREAFASQKNTGEVRSEKWITDGLNSTDPMYDARLERTNWRAHNKTAEEERKRNEAIANAQLDYLEERYGEDSNLRPDILD